MTHPLRRDLLVTALLGSAALFALAAWAGHLPSNENCPDTSLGETPADCPWGGAARAMIAEADAGRGKKVVELLRELLPDLDRSLQSDSRRSSWKPLWGRSINFDELAKNVIVHPAIVKALGERFGNRAPMILTHFNAEKISGSPAAAALGKPITTDPAGHPLVHAGMEHTYGYLFSLLRTSFGYKRARWVHGEIEAGFGLTPGVLSPRPEAGTLFANVTYFAGHIAFRGNESRIEILKKGGRELPAEIRDFDFSRLAPIRLEESVLAKDGVGEMRTVLLRTDFVPFFHPQADTHLLVYSVVDPSNGGEVLITAFPVAQSFVDMATAASGMGDGKPVQTRYNGFVEGVTGVQLTGVRKMLAATAGVAATKSRTIGSTGASE